MTGWCAMRTGICRCRRRGVGRPRPRRRWWCASGKTADWRSGIADRTGRQAGAAPGDKRGEEVETLRWDTTDSAAPVEAELPGDEGLELAGREGCPGLTAAVRASRWSAPSCSDRSGFKPFFERKTKTLKLEATAASRWSAP